MEQYGYGTLVVGLPLWFAVLPEDPWRAENALDDFYTRTCLGLNELKQRALERRDCPFRRIRVAWDTTPEAWREWSRRRSADYDDAANTGLENAIPVAKIITWLSESLDLAISKTECPDSEAPSMGLRRFCGGLRCGPRKVSDCRRNRGVQRLQDLVTYARLLRHRSADTWNRPFRNWDRVPVRPLGLCPRRCPQTLRGTAESDSESLATVLGHRYRSPPCKNSMLRCSTA